MVSHIFSSLLPTIITDWDDKKGQFLNEKIKLWWWRKKNRKKKITGCTRWLVLALARTTYAAFSALMISAMPSYISLTAWNSVKPMRRLLEMS